MSGSFNLNSFRDRKQVAYAQQTNTYQMLQNISLTLKFVVFIYSLYIYIYIYISKVKLATIVEGEPKAPFSIATTPRCRGGRYSIPRIAPLYPWTVPYNAEC